MYYLREAGEETIQMLKDMVLVLSRAIEYLEMWLSSQDQ